MDDYTDARFRLRANTAIEPVLIIPAKRASLLARTQTFLKHPVTAIALSAIIGSILVPQLASVTNHRALIDQARFQRCQEIHKDSVQTDRELNTMVTMLLIFWKDVKRPGVSLEKEQAELRPEMRQKYLAFDSDAWWWYARLQTDLNVLRIPQASGQQVKTLADDYANNLSESTVELDKLWNLLLRNNYNPSDPRSDQLVKNSDAKMRVLQQKRHEIVGQIVFIFSPQSGSIRDLLSDVTK